MYAEYNQLKLYSSFSEEVGAPNHTSHIGQDQLYLSFILQTLPGVSCWRGICVLCFHVETRTSLCIELHVQSRLGLGMGGWGGKDPSHALKPGQLKFRELSALPHCSSVFLSVPLGVKSPGPGTSELPGPEADVHLLLWLPTGGHTEMTPD